MEENQLSCWIPSCKGVPNCEAGDAVAEGFIKTMSLIFTLLFFMLMCALQDKWTYEG
jgi:hypothetical protein